MGKALEWLGVAGVRNVAMQLLAGSVDEGKSQVEVWAKCPFHADSDPSFRYTPGGDYFYCYGCEESGDLIKLFGHLHGLNDSDAFKKFAEAYAPDVRLTASKRQIKAVETKPALAPKSYVPSESDDPPALWSEKGGVFVGHAVDRLQQDQSQLARLAKWGITPETASLCRIGYNERDKYPTRSSWGLPKELNAQGKEKKIWLPTGFVIPCYVGGELKKIKIRRDHVEENAKESWKKSRYVLVRGSSKKRLSVYGNPAWTIWVIIETERDGALVWQEGRPYHIGAVATGSASSRPDSYTAKILALADIILVALDNDAAGLKNSHKFWLDQYPQAIRTPVPPSAGKDVGNLPAAGVNVADWLLAVLPSHVRKKIEKHADLSKQAQAPVQSIKPAYADDPYFQQVFDVLAELPEAQKAFGDMYRRIRTSKARLVVFDGYVRIQSWCQPMDRNLEQDYCTIQVPWVDDTTVYLYEVFQLYYYDRLPVVDELVVYQAEGTNG